jgi:Rrf2 family protein
MLTQKARYAVHALIVLAEHQGEEPLMIADIAERARVPRKFLEQILLELKKRAIVRSVRGRSGGYFLGRDAKDITFADIMRVTDGPIALSPCASVTAYTKCNDCFDEKTCAIRKVLVEARDATASVLEARTLASMVTSTKRRAKT